MIMETSSTPITPKSKQISIARKPSGLNVNQQRESTRFHSHDITTSIASKIRIIKLLILSSLYSFWVPLNTGYSFI